MLRYSVHMPHGAGQPASIEISGYFGRNTSCTRLGNAQVIKACTAGRCHSKSLDLLVARAAGIEAAARYCVPGGRGSPSLIKSRYKKEAERATPLTARVGRFLHT